MKPLSILLLTVAATHASEIIPSAFEKSRYAETVGKSPFHLESAPGVPETPTPPQRELFARGVTGLHGKHFVLLQRPGEERTIPLLEGDTSDAQLTLERVTVGKSFRETKVIVRCGTEVREVGFQEPHNAPSASSPPQLRLPGSGAKAPESARPRVRVISK